MSTETDFLSLVLPENGEFFNNWSDPINQNFELIDDWLDDLYKALVSTGSGSTFSALKGSLNSLAERLAVSINNDGTIDVASSPGVVELATSAVTGQFASPAERMDGTDFEVFTAAAPFSGSRFSIDTLAGYPHSPLDAGTAIDAANELNQAFRNLGDYAKSLLTSELSTLSPGQKLAESGRQYQDMLARARGGDMAALGGLQGAASGYLEQARGYYASSDSYVRIFEEVQGALTELGARAGPEQMYQENTAAWQSSLLEPSYPWN